MKSDKTHSIKKIKAVIFLVSGIMCIIFSFFIGLSNFSITSTIAMVLGFCLLVYGIHKINDLKHEK